MFLEYKMLKKLKYRVKLLKINLLLKRAKIIVWDYDGTLYQNSKLVENLEKAYFKYFQKNTGKDWTLKHFRTESAKNDGWAKTISIYTQKNLTNIMDDVEKNFKKHLYLKKDNSLITKITSLKNKKHLILSNSKTLDIKKGLEAIGFNKKNSIFEKIVGRDSYGFYKPDPRIFKMIQEYSKLPTKKHLMIGDSLKDDILPAKKAGFNTLHINDLMWFWKLY
jgi:HAD superfamily hydrolase (TIGR01549 family)